MASPGRRLQLLHGSFGSVGSGRIDHDVDSFEPCQRFLRQLLHIADTARIRLPDGNVDSFCCQLLPERLQAVVPPSGRNHVCAFTSKERGR
jgi:hypothetical protein